MKRILLACFHLFPFLVYSQGFQNLEPSTSHRSLAGAGASLLLNEATVWHSPGAMAFVKGNRASVNTNISLFTGQYKFTNGKEEGQWKSNENLVPIDFFGVFGKENSKWKAGLGVYNAYGYGLNWAQDWPGRKQILSRELRFHTLQPTLSYALSSRWGIGVGLAASKASLQEKRELSLDPVGDQPYSVAYSGKDWGLGWVAGLYYQVPEFLAISLRYQSRITHKISDGKARINPAPAVANAAGERMAFTSEVPVPSRITLGVSVPINEEFTVALDADYQHWKGIKRNAFLNKDPDDNRIEVHREFRYKTAGALRVGIQHKTNDQLTLQAGSAYVLSPVRSGDFSTAYPDADRFVLSGGAGYVLANSHWKINFAVSYEKMESTQRPEPEQELPGTFSYKFFSPGIGMVYSW